jgi:hypothetical protein
VRFEGLSDCVRLASATNHGKNPGLILRPACKVPPLFPKELSLRCATKRTACCRRNSWIVWNILTNRSSPGLRFLLAELGARTRGIGGRGFDTASACRLRRRQGGSRGAGPGGSTCRSTTTSTGRLPPIMRLAGHSANASFPQPQARHPARRRYRDRGRPPLGEGIADPCNLDWIAMQLPGDAVLSGLGANSALFSLQSLRRAALRHAETMAFLRAGRCLIDWRGRRAEIWRPHQHVRRWSTLPPPGRLLAVAKRAVPTANVGPAASSSLR